MRTFKFNVITLILMLMLLTLFSCGNTQHWVFKYSVEEIVSIEIIEFNTETSGRYTVLTEVDKELYAEVVADVEALPFKKYDTELVAQSGRGIKINFASGEYDIITAKEPKHHEYYDYVPSQGGIIVGSNSLLECKASRFNAVIEKYYSE